MSEREGLSPQEVASEFMDFASPELALDIQAPLIPSDFFEEAYKMADSSSTPDFPEQPRHIPGLVYLDMNQEELNGFPPVPIEIENALLGRPDVNASANALDAFLEDLQENLIDEHQPLRKKTKRRTVIEEEEEVIDHVDHARRSSDSDTNSNSNDDNNNNNNNSNDEEFISIMNASIDFDNQEEEIAPPAPYVGRPLVIGSSAQRSRNARIDQIREALGETGYLHRNRFRSTYFENVDVLKKNFQEKLRRTHNNENLHSNLDGIAEVLDVVVKKRNPTLKQVAELLKDDESVYNRPIKALLAATKMGELHGIDNFFHNTLSKSFIYKFDLQYLSDPKVFADVAKNGHLKWEDAMANLTHMQKSQVEGCSDIESYLKFGITVMAVMNTYFCYISKTNEVAILCYKRDLSGNVKFEINVETVENFEMFLKETIRMPNGLDFENCIAWLQSWLHGPNTLQPKSLGASMLNNTPKRKEKRKRTRQLVGELHDLESGESQNNDNMSITSDSSNEHDDPSGPEPTIKTSSISLAKFWLTEHKKLYNVYLNFTVDSCRYDLFPPCVASNQFCNAYTTALKTYREEHDDNDPNWNLRLQRDVDDLAQKRYFALKAIPSNLNTFPGFAFKPRPYKDILFGPRDIAKLMCILNHMRIMCENDHHFIFKMCWFAKMFQHPWIKAESVINLCGDQGVGKSWIIGVICYLLGCDNCLKLTRTCDFSGRFSKPWPKLVEFAEFSKDGIDKSGYKEIVTGHERVAESKFKDAKIVENLSNIITTTNHPDDLPLDNKNTDDRRNVAFSITVPQMMVRAQALGFGTIAEYIASLNNILKSENDHGYQLLADFFYAIDLNKLKYRYSKTPQSSYLTWDRVRQRVNTDPVLNAWIQMLEAKSNTATFDSEQIWSTDQIFIKDFIGHFSGWLSSANEKRNPDTPLILRALQTYCPSVKFDAMRKYITFPSIDIAWNQVREAVPGIDVYLKIGNIYTNDRIQYMLENPFGFTFDSLPVALRDAIRKKHDTSIHETINRWIEGELAFTEETQLTSEFFASQTRESNFSLNLKNKLERIQQKANSLDPLPKFVLQTLNRTPQQISKQQLDRAVLEKEWNFENRKKAFEFEQKRKILYLALGVIYQRICADRDRHPDLFFKIHTLIENTRTPPRSIAFSAPVQLPLDQWDHDLEAELKHYNDAVLIFVALRIKYYTNSLPTLSNIHFNETSQFILDIEKRVDMDIDPTTNC